MWGYLGVESFMNRIFKMILVALAISIGAQFSLNLFVDGFLITLSIIILPVLLYKNKELNPILIGAITAVVSPLFRAMIMILQAGDPKFVIGLVYPDVIFYLTYGVIFYLVYWKKKEGSTTEFLVAVFLSDFISNLMEMSVRTKVTGLDGTILKGLALIAFGRLLVVFAIVVYLKWYKSFLVQEEHENRYRKLMLLTSAFKSEIYFMQKNMVYIEGIMKKSYKTYKLSESEDVSDELKKSILDITKDVHEIKKDYIRVIQGLEQGFSDKLPPSIIKIKDLIDILETNTLEYLESTDSKVRFKCKVNSKVNVYKHYYLMSVLRNLINNAIEACPEGENSVIELKVNDIEDKVVFIIEDNGAGMEADIISYIYNPGFSTKFNEETGDICRGIGLTMVRSLVTDTFRGTVEVESELGQGTKFQIEIPIESLEVS